jgi:hypothetical protein
MSHSLENLAHSGTVALQLIGDDHPWQVHEPFEQLAKKLLRDPLVPAPLDQDL